MDHKKTILDLCRVLEITLDNQTRLVQAIMLAKSYLPVETFSIVDGIAESARSAETSCRDIVQTSRESVLSDIRDIKDKMREEIASSGDC